MMRVAPEEGESGRGCKVGWERSRGFNAVVSERIDVLLHEEGRWV